jgi:membrane-bound lytic murein transglycosylase A
VTDKALWRWQHARAERQEINLEPVEFGSIRGWTEDDHCAALKCYLQSAALNGFPLPAENALPRILHESERARAFFEDNFAAYRVSAEPGLLTAYFEPVLKGSRAPAPGFPLTVYRRPDELKPLPPGHPLTEQGFTAGRDTGAGFEPYETRAEIEAGALAGRDLELLYLADPVDAFVMHVQGSGLVELTDGTRLRLSFDGKNGHPYTSISKLLVERGDLKHEDAHLDGLLAWLRAQSEPQATLNENESYIFFKELDHSATGPKGSAGMELRSGRSLAADPLYHATGTPIWVEAPELTFEGSPFRRLLAVQDTGSAIVGSQRGDVFAGMGPEAGRTAGRIRHRCEFIVLRPGRC